MDNVSKVNGCYGCGLCVTVCPSHIIELHLNEDGFYKPHLTFPDKCVKCKLCVEVCSWLHDDLALRDKYSSAICYAAWSPNDEVRKRCSSGGIGFEIGKYLLSKKYKVCGVRYNTDSGRAEHYIATTVKELIPSIGSKYIQSYTVDGFRAISRKEKYLVTGTPCQIDSFRRYIQKFRCEDSFILLDFFCHGVPSMWMWRKYMAWVEKKVGKITYVAWRNKHTGWHDSWSMQIDSEEHYGDNVDWHDSYNLLIRGKKSFVNSRLSQGDMFYRMFLSDSCLGKACYDRCKFKYNRSSADIRIGDLWGKAYRNNEEGVSAAIAFTRKGNDILHRCDSILIPHPIEVVAEGQMSVAPSRPSYYERLRKCLNDSNSTIHDVDAIVRRDQNLNRLKRICKSPVASIKRLMKRILK